MCCPVPPFASASPGLSPIEYRYFRNKHILVPIRCVPFAHPGFSRRRSLVLHLWVRGVHEKKGAQAGSSPGEGVVLGLPQGVCFHRYDWLRRIFPARRGCHSAHHVGVKNQNKSERGLPLFYPPGHSGIPAPASHARRFPFLRSPLALVRHELP